MSVSDAAPLELHVDSSGAGADVVICHGLFGSGTNWRTVAGRLSASYRVHLVDARNHGRSPHAETMSYTAMANDLGHTLDRLGLDRAHLVGHSMGGKTVMTLALAQPQRIVSLTVVDVAPVAYDHHFSAELTAMRSIDIATLESRAQADAALAEHLDDASLRAFLLQNLTRAGQHYRWRINLDAIDRARPELTGFPPLRGSYAGPTLVLRGGRSDYVLEQHRPALAALFPALHIRTVEQAGHWLHAEAPDRFVALLTEHLDASGR